MAENAADDGSYGQVGHSRDGLLHLFGIIRDDMYLSFVKDSLEDMHRHGTPKHVEAHSAFLEAFQPLESLIRSGVETLLTDTECDARIAELKNRCSVAVHVAWKYNVQGIWDISAWRELYVVAQLVFVWASMVQLHSARVNGPKDEHEDLSRMMKAVDMGFIMGGPAELLQPFAAAIEQLMREGSDRRIGTVMCGSAESKRLKPDNAGNVVCAAEEIPHGVYMSAKASESDTKVKQVGRLHLPDLRRFKAEYFDCDRPVVITGCCGGWAALSKWRNLTWLKEKFGHRYVPLEMGLHAESTWHEAVMSMEKFVGDFLEPSVHSDERKEPLRSFTGDRIAYLAQHPLFDQFPDMLQDFSPPMYCDVGELWRTNAWIGTRGTITPLHFDSYDNLLTQVVGYKRVRLYAQADTPFLYRSTRPWTSQTKWPTAGHGEDSTSVPSVDAGSTTGSGRKGNVSLVDIDNVDLARFPLFRNAVTCTETILGPGDMLYIPARYWHHVASLSTSISLNFLF
mmetsp:Transcript_12497/g.45571  ORF Transcript_12497/g.45571 Transcript_12497/m.45571 type:complete len:510 (+) Transcript_12497:400-1929(+)